MPISAIRGIQAFLGEYPDRRIRLRRLNFAPRQYCPRARYEAATMRRQLIEALTYPRLLILKIIDAQDCDHDSLFDATSARCHHCSMGRECHWASLNRNRETPKHNCP